LNAGTNPDYPPLSKD